MKEHTTKLHTRFYTRLHLLLPSDMLQHVSHQNVSHQNVSRKRTHERFHCLLHATQRRRKASERPHLKDNTSDPTLADPIQDNDDSLDTSKEL